MNWYQANARDLPWRKLWSLHQNPYHVWLSEIMLQQTLITVVTPRFLDVVGLYPDVQSFARASEAQVREVFRGLGYYRRFRFFHQACQVLAAKLVSSEKDRFPRSYGEWLDVPGVGPYVAAAVSSITLNEPQAVLDGNVERVLCRLEALRIIPNVPASKRQLKVIADELLNRSSPGDHNQAVMELGQRVCTPTSPRCDECPVQIHCKSFAESSQRDCPLPKLRPETVDIDLAMVIATTKHGKVVLNKRPNDAHFLGGTDGFPTYIRTSNGTWHRDLQKLQFNNGISKHSNEALKPPVASQNLKFVGICKHSITKHKIRIHVWHEPSIDMKKQDDLNTIKLETHAVDAALLANLDRKAWNLYLGKVTF